MYLVEQASVAVAALPMAELAAYLRLSSGFADDAAQNGRLELSLRGALAAIEARTGQVIFERGFLWRIARWSEPRGQPLPVAPVSAIASVSLVDRVGQARVLAPQTYALVMDARRPQINPIAGWLPPVPADGSAEVVFQAGFGAAWQDVPADLRQAVLMLAAAQFELRLDAAASPPIPLEVLGLIEPYRRVRVGGARA